jgi:hypothetical protein
VSVDQPTLRQRLLWLALTADEVDCLTEAINADHFAKVHLWVFEMSLPITIRS